MSALQLGLQVVTWTWSGSQVNCEGYLGVPSPTPVFIGLWPTGSPRSQAACAKIAAALATRLQSFPGAQRAASMPCAGLLPFVSAKGCHAYHVAGVRKLLVVVADEHSPLSTIPPIPGPWLRAADDSFRVMLVLESGQDPAAAVPQLWRAQQAEFWSAVPEEVVPQIIRAAGIEEAERRIFISYVRKESGEAAEQLFDELTHRGFDVYLDRFRGVPGTDFRQRLARELAHKSMVVLLASPGVLKSKWTLFEILFARLYGLGILALDASGAFPGGSIISRLPVVSTEIRTLQSSEIASLTPTLTLDASCVKPLGDEIAEMHTQALLRRRQRLVLTLDGLLRHVGAHGVTADPAGWVSARASGSGAGRSYSIRVSPRPAELGDFQLSHVQGVSSHAVVAAPASWERGAPREAIDWLQSISNVQLIEEGGWLQAARDMKAGTL